MDAAWQNVQMNKFKTWLDSNRGMATALSEKLNVNRTNITNAKTGRLLMPVGWMPTIVKLSKKELSFKDLVLEREFYRQKKLDDRTSTNN